MDRKIFSSYETKQKTETYKYHSFLLIEKQNGTEWNKKGHRKSEE